MMSKEELIEQTAGLISACKMDYYDIVKEINKLVSSIDSLPNGEASRVSKNEDSGNVCHALVDEYDCTGKECTGCGHWKPKKT